MSNEMLYKHIRTILIVAVVILALCVLGSGLNNLAFRRGAGEREAELERRATNYEKLYTETNKLYSEALGIIERTESELAGIREANSRLGKIAEELRAENRILERTINELGDLHSELAKGTGRAEELIRAIEREARRALECLDRIQAGNREAD